MCVCVCVCVCVRTRASARAFSVGKNRNSYLVHSILLLEKSFAVEIFDLWQQILQYIEVKRKKKESVRCGRIMFCIYITHKEML